MSKPEAIIPAEVDFTDPASPRSLQFDDRYLGPLGAFGRARQVFLPGNGLPERWRDRDSFTILETGFGLGNNFLATWAAWRDDPRRPRRLRFVSVEKHPLRATDLRRALAASPEPALAARLCDAWPPHTPDLHLLAFEDGAVELSLILGDATTALRDLVAAVDAIFLDGFAPACNPSMWTPELFKALGRLAAPGATAATWRSDRVVRDGLRLAGFDWRAAPGSGGGSDFDVTLADHAARAGLRVPVARVGRPEVRRVAIVGGGLAGAACAQALAREGVACVVIDRHAEPASEASGNVAGLFHGVFHPDDGLHARTHRAAALMAQRVYGDARADGVPGRGDGLLRLVPEHADAAPLAARLAASKLPDDYVQAWSPAQVQAVGGPACAAWFYPGGGWMAPAALVRWMLARSGAEWRGGVEVARLVRDGTWRLVDTDDRVIDDVDAVVFANAAQATALASRATDAAGRPLAADAPWWPPLATTRGQISRLAAIAIASVGGHAPMLPIAGSGYALALPDGDAVCGATSTADDPDPSLRLADHAHNLRQWAAVTGRSALALDAGSLVDRGALTGRVGWRATASDRLPLLGAMPARPEPDATRLPDQPRHWPRVPGLFVASGLGSRGLTWAPLAGRLLAAWITGSPYPVAADLIDALDPARFATRAVRASRRSRDA